MSAEVTVNIDFAFTKGNAHIEASESYTVDVAGTNAIDNIQTIGITSEALLLGDTAPGMIKVKNLDAQNFVEFSPNGTNMLLELGPGETHIFKLSRNAAGIQAKADTAPVKVQVTAIAV